MQPNCTYDVARIYGKSAFGNKLESADVRVPTLGDYSAPISGLPFVPASAYMCVYYPVTTLHVEVCSVPFPVH